MMPCLLPPPVQAYHKELVDLVAERLGLTFTQRQAIPAHWKRCSMISSGGIAGRRSTSADSGTSA